MGCALLMVAGAFGQYLSDVSHESRYSIHIGKTVELSEPFTLWDGGGLLWSCALNQIDGEFLDHQRLADLPAGTPVKVVRVIMIRYPLSGFEQFDDVATVVVDRGEQSISATICVTERVPWKVLPAPAIAEKIVPAPATAQ